MHVHVPQYDVCLGSYKIQGENVKTIASYMHVVFKIFVSVLRRDRLTPCMIFTENASTVVKTAQKA